MLKEVYDILRLISCAEGCKDTGKMVLLGTPSRTSFQLEQMLTSYEFENLERSSMHG